MDLCRTGILLWSWARPAGSWKPGKLSVSHSNWRNTEGLRDSLAWDRAAAGNRNKNQGKKPDRKLPCHVFLLKYHQGLSLLPYPLSHSLSQGVWTQHSQNGIFCLMVCTVKSYTRLGALEMMLHIPSLWARLCANSWFNKNCKIIYIP